MPVYFNVCTYVCNKGISKCRYYIRKVNWYTVLAVLYKKILYLDQLRDKIVCIQNVYSMIPGLSTREKELLFKSKDLSLILPGGERVRFVASWHDKNFLFFYNCRSIIDWLQFFLLRTVPFMSHTSMDILYYQLLPPVLYLYPRILLFKTAPYTKRHKSPHRGHLGERNE